jgi:type IV pilus assembly protein PilV
MKNLYQHRQRGGTLIEVLISMVIIMLGVLGAIGLKVASSRAVADSNLRSTAAMSAQDILERARANSTLALAGQYNVVAGDALASPAVTMAQQDLTQWYGRLAANLPAGTATISVGPSTATVVIQWLERSPQNNTGQTVTFSFNSRL